MSGKGKKSGSAGKTTAKRGKIVGSIIPAEHRAISDPAPTVTVTAPSPTSPLLLPARAAMPVNLEADNGKRYWHEQANVEEVMIGKQDHGILTCRFRLNYFGSSSIMGGYRHSCEVPTGEEVPRKRILVGLPAMADYILKLLDTFSPFGIDDVQSIVGKSCYALREKNGQGSQVLGIRVYNENNGRSKTWDFADWDSEMPTRDQARLILNLKDIDLDNIQACVRSLESLIRLVVPITARA